MLWPSKHAAVNTAILVLIAVAWLYTEIIEYNDRERLATEINQFMTRGDRFTAGDGAALEARVEALENGLPQ